MNFEKEVSDLILDNLRRTLKIKSLTKGAVKPSDLVDKSTKSLGFSKLQNTEIRP